MPLPQFAHTEQQEGYLFMHLNPGYRKVISMSRVWVKPSLKRICGQTQLIFLKNAVHSSQLRGLEVETVDIPRLDAFTLPCLHLVA